jgi:hypothetical protein
LDNYIEEDWEDNLEDVEGRDTRRQGYNPLLEEK